LPVLEGPTVSDGAARALWRFSLWVFAISVVTTLMVMIPALESLTQVRWSRIAPFGQLGCQVLLAGALIRYATDAAPSIVRRSALAGLAAGRLMRVSAPVMVVMAGCMLAMFSVPRRWASHAATALTVLVVTAAVWASPRGEGLTTVPAGSPGELSLARWISQQT